MQEVSGIGPVIAATLIAHMPELGQLSAEGAAALAGVVPYNHDSGPRKGTRSIRGGRAEIRYSLYMSAMSAVRRDSILKAFYLRLRAAGKKPMVALTAAMCKLIVLLNHLLKHPTFKLQKAVPNHPQENAPLKPRKAANGSPQESAPSSPAASFKKAKKYRLFSTPLLRAVLRTGYLAPLGCGGRILKAKTRKAANRIANILRVAAQAVSRADGKMEDYVRRFKGRLGKAEGIVAGAHKLARIIWGAIVTGQPYDEPSEAR